MQEQNEVQPIDEGKKRKTTKHQRQAFLNSIQSIDRSPGASPARPVPYVSLLHLLAIADCITHQTTKCHSSCTLARLIRAFKLDSRHGDVVSIAYSYAASVHSWRRAVDCVHRLWHVAPFAVIFFFGGGMEHPTT